MRQIVLTELGYEGQARLRDASVLCVGAGGLGTSALMYLTAAGVGHIGIADDDVVNISNLQRQVLFKESDQGRPKVQAIAVALKALNSECNIEMHHTRITATNTELLLRQYDIIIDGTDNFNSKFLLNDACVKFCKPLIYAAITGFEAQVSTFGTKTGPCYRCLYPKPPVDRIANCAEAGVIGAIAGITGSLQALETIKMILGIKWCQSHGLNPLVGKLWMLDAKSMNTHILNLAKNTACSACNNNQHYETLLAQDNVVDCRTVQTVSPEAVKTLIGHAIFIDVRENHELSSGMIPDAKHIPLALLLNDSTAINDLSKENTIVVYCRHGIRSLTAAKHLISNGYTKVFHIKGGIPKEYQCS